MIEGSPDVLIGDDNGVAAAGTSATAEAQLFDEHFVVVDERTGEAVQNVEVDVMGPAGAASTGGADAAGKTAFVQSTGAQAVTLDVRQTTLVIG